MARVREVEARERPLAPGERIDLDRADRAEIERLPRVGPELARRIVEHRETHGPFGSLAALDEVPGVGAALLASLERYVSFSGARLPARGGPPGAAPRPSGRGCEEGARVAVNRATEAELDCLPGIGPALARAIVADRASRGPYRQVEDLARVKGIGPALLGRLAPRLLVP
jgi:competence protein ComEA